MATVLLTVIAMAKQIFSAIAQSPASWRGRQAMRKYELVL
jgi:hypothetical protein